MTTIGYKRTNDMECMQRQELINKISATIGRQLDHNDIRTGSHHEGRGVHVGTLMVTITDAEYRMLEDTGTLRSIGTCVYIN